MSLIVTDSFGALLYKSLKSSFAKHKVKVSDEADFYVYNLLTEYLTSSKFNTVSGLWDPDKPWR